MKNFKIILMILLLSISSSQAEDNNSTESVIANTEAEPETDDKINPELLNTLPAVNILNLSGTDCDGAVIKRFVIHTLPDVNTGTLYLADGITEVTPNQCLSIEEADGLQFDPNENFEGNATFTYSSVDTSDMVDSSPATVTIPIVAPVVNGASTNEDNTSVPHVVHDDSCTCKAYESSIPTFSKFGILLIIMLTVLAGSFFTKKEI